MPEGEANAGPCGPAPRSARRAQTTSTRNLGIAQFAIPSELIGTVSGCAIVSLAGWLGVRRVLDTPPRQVLAGG